MFLSSSLTCAGSCLASRVDVPVSRSSLPGVLMSSLTKAVRRLPELVVNTPTVQLLRPLLNKILGGFRGEADDQGVTDIGENGEAVTVPILDTILGQDVVIPSHILSEEHSQGAAGVSLIASVTREDSSTVDVKFFDPTSCEFHRQNRVKKSGVMTTDQHREALRSVPL